MIGEDSSQVYPTGTKHPDGELIGIARWFDCDLEANGHETSSTSPQTADA